MTTVNACPPTILQFFNNLGQPNAGGTLLTQVGGVNYPTYEDAAGTTALPNPIPLNSRGEVSNVSGVSCQLFLVAGITYTFTLYDANRNQLGSAQSVIAPISTTPQPTPVSEWSLQSVPTYISSTQFSVPQDQISTFTVNRRVQAVIGSGSIYGYISASAYTLSTNITTVTVVWDSTTLNNTVTEVYVALLNSVNASVPQQYTQMLSYAGNPNNNVAGQVGWLCYDTTDNLIYTCTTSGTASTAVWTWISGQFGSFKTASALTGNQTLTSADSGYWIAWDGNGTLNLPQASTCAEGTAIAIHKNNASYSATIAANATDTIIGMDTTSHTSIVIGTNTGLIVFVRSTGSTSWVMASGDLALFYSDAFPKTASSGYQKFPSGLILQWGQMTTSGGTGTWTLPITFPVALSIAGGTPIQASVVVGIASGSTTSTVNFTSNLSSGGVSSNTLWVFAIGY